MIQDSMSTFVPSRGVPWRGVELCGVETSLWAWHHHADGVCITYARIRTGTDARITARRVRVYTPVVRTGMHA